MGDRICIERKCLSWTDFDERDSTKNIKFSICTSCPHCGDGGAFRLSNISGKHVLTCTSCFRDFIIHGEMIFQYDKFPSLEDYVADATIVPPF